MGKAYDQLKANYKRFVQEYVSSGNLWKAAEKSGSKAKNLSQAGKELLAREDVTEAIFELQQAMQLEHEVTRESLACQYDFAFKVAIGAIAPSAMVAAVTGKARLYGLDIQKTESDTPEEQGKLLPELKAILDYALSKTEQK